jgi:hypothetical protein
VNYCLLLRLYGPFLGADGVFSLPMHLYDKEDQKSASENSTDHRDATVKEKLFDYTK